MVKNSNLIRWSNLKNRLYCIHERGQYGNTLKCQECELVVEYLISFHTQGACLESELRVRSHFLVVDCRMRATDSWVQRQRWEWLLVLISSAHNSCRVVVVSDWLAWRSHQLRSHFPRRWLSCLSLPLIHTLIPNKYYIVSKIGCRCGHWHEIEGESQRYQKLDQHISQYSIYFCYSSKSNVTKVAYLFYKEEQHKSYLLNNLVENYL